jgi:hypothetical protein
VIEGNPREAGPFTMRLWFPAGTRVAPHYHPGIEHAAANRCPRSSKPLAIVIGEDRTLIAEKWYSASHTELTPKASAASTSAKHSAKASRSVIPARVGNSMKTPDSMSDGRLAYPGEVRLGNLRAWGLRGGDVHRGRASARRFHVGQPFFLCRISADSHMTEPPHLFETRLPPALRDRAPRSPNRDNAGPNVRVGGITARHGADVEWGLLSEERMTDKVAEGTCGRATAGAASTTHQQRAGHSGRGVWALPLQRALGSCKNDRSM